MYERNYKEAKEIYLRILKADSNNIVANKAMGIIWREEKDYEKARSYFLKCIGLEPNSGELYHLYAHTYLLEKKYK